MLRLVSSVEEVPFQPETGAPRSGTMDLTMVTTNVTKAISTTLMAVTSSVELSQVGFVMMEDLGLQTSAGNGVGTVKDSQLKNATTTTQTS